MKLTKTNIHDFDDLIFESRNKEYGSYQQRKKYNSVIIIGIILSSFIVCIAVIIPFILRPDSATIFVGGNRFTKIQTDNMESPKWTPGFQRGKAVRVRFVIPLDFSPG